ncbi:ScbR family autoregulator-binding transcription factor [Rhodococcus sp. NCIMB 12038]|uniref:ScbR family autoregulator-binding transcription factor n=1 Tax=Rhodococcus sp. NCIMB 12038 TaxID=933800 RepID=UPI000B3CD99A|nr:ScbR family autoregulator-binding transcription factor [Rhodococcus sp. NCIMB 12038]OUS90087.1 TetR family transcriptional regulator [Rhodococcus sp. NCIMB 12038]
MAKQARAAATRHQVLEGAALSFEKLGYGGASLSGILSYADVTKGALYFHFESKEALAWAVIKEQHAMAMLAAQRVLATARSPMEAILLCAKEMARQLLTEPIVRAGVRLTLELGTSRGPATDPYIDWTDTLVALAGKAREAGELRATVDPAALARFLVSSFTGMQLVSEALTGRADLYERLADMWGLLLPSIASPDMLPRLLELVALRDDVAS